MGSLSTQALALFLVLSPGFLFLLGLYLSEPQNPTRQDMNRGVIIDTSIFVIASAFLHLTIGFASLIALEAVNSCSVGMSLAEVASERIKISPEQRCGMYSDILNVFIYSLVLCISAFNLGKAVPKWLWQKPAYFVAIFGPHYEVIKGKQQFVIVNIMTNIIHEGKVLMYEGNLIEIAVNANKTIIYVSIGAVKRYYLDNSGKNSSTTPRHMFKSVDENNPVPSRMFIAGDKINNIVTRTYSTDLSDAPDGVVTGKVENSSNVLGEMHGRRSIVSALRKLFRLS